VIKQWVIRNVVFLDESHFDRRRLLSVYGWSLSGEPNIYVDQSSLDQVRFNVSMLLTLTPPNQVIPCYVKIRTKKNTAERFIKFVKRAFEQRYIVAGNVIVLDNARIHNSNMVRRDLIPWLRNRGINLMSLPTYSPG